ncbi:hypothetical protein [Rubritalea tangerina]|uniref:hypothetical protein n=1 Tax=Rubritalea tangerina TaxID=430798 RepID=UPI00361AA241
MPSAGPAMIIDFDSVPTSSKPTATNMAKVLATVSEMPIGTERNRSRLKVRFQFFSATSSLIREYSAL